MDFQSFFPIWDKLTATQQKRILSSLIERKVTKGTVVHNGNLDCIGLIMIKSGQLRAYIISEEGREITIYRLFERDLCLLAAPCIIHSLQFDVIIEAEKDSELWVIPAGQYKRLLEESAPIANYSTELVASRLSDVIWLIEQILWKRLDKRLADFLLEESAIDGTDKLKTTHEIIANHLGSHREVITRLLRHFQNKGIVKLSRSTIEIIDKHKLKELSNI